VPNTSQIRRLTEADFDDFIPIVANAYPGLKIVSAEDRQKFRERLVVQDQDPTMGFYGLYRDGRLLGGMKFFDFTMNLHGVKTLVGGLGLVAVDLLHKKKAVAKEMVAYFLDHYRQKGATMTALYPFRPDFYRQMGYGYGTKMNQYRVKPAALPRGSSREHVSFLTAGDKEAVMACYNRYLDRTHGMMSKPELSFNYLFENLANRVIGYKQDGRLLGYLVFDFKADTPGNFLQQDLIVHELIYETREALAELLTFLHTQFDQVDRIVFNTQDENFHFLLHDPRNGTGGILPHVYHESNTQGVGLMYRVMDTPAVFRLLSDHNFGRQTCRLRITLADSFFPANEGSVTVAFEDGRPHLLPSGSNTDATIRLDVAEFSSLLMGAVSFRSLYEYGLAHLSNPAHLHIVNQLFHVEQKPICLTRF
jgi:predicted acetyltransferase